MQPSGVTDPGRDVRDISDSWPLGDIGERRGAASVWNVYEIDLGHALDELGGPMLRSALGSPEHVGTTDTRLWFIEAAASRR
jgi:hypothetical protein